jgi:hypothetical protein
MDIIQSDTSHYLATTKHTTQKGELSSIGLKNAQALGLGSELKLAWYFTAYTVVPGGNAHISDYNVDLLKLQQACKKRDIPEPTEKDLISILQYKNKPLRQILDCMSQSPRKKFSVAQKNKTIAQYTRCIYFPNGFKFSNEQLKRISTAYWTNQYRIRHGKIKTNRDSAIVKNDLGLFCTLFEHSNPATKNSGTYNHDTIYTPSDTTSYYSGFTKLFDVYRVRFLYNRSSTRHSQST